MGPADFREARRRLGLSAAEMAKVLGLSDGRVVRLYEAGDRPVSGPIATLLELVDSLPETRRRRWVARRLSVS